MTAERENIANSQMGPYSNPGDREAKSCQARELKGRPSLSCFDPCYGYCLRAGRSAFTRPAHGCRDIMAMESEVSYSMFLEQLKRTRSCC